MEIYILRHGEAELRETGIPDRGRKLTGKGKRVVRAVVKAAKKARCTPAIILTSPLRRAQETAAVAAKVLGCLNVAETRNLLPGANPHLLWKELGGMKDIEQILVAGHEPHLGRLIAFLLEAAVVTDLKKGALVKIATPGRLGPPRGVLKWMITPRLAAG